MTKIKDFEDAMEDIFNDQEEKRQSVLDELTDRIGNAKGLVEELLMENKLLWATIDRIKKEVGKV